ncbi:ferrous iron transport protein A [Candidatus Geothermarchaeota archaeon ex4572_27]|nr:MAG: ferrous iron transport protein A [Candidatus Geothermarchaeota archaeon ex4572_27]
MAGEVRLSDARVGAEYVVVAVGGPPHVRSRIMSLGLTPGVRLKVVGSSPLGDPMHLEVRGSNVSIRKAEASVVTVREVG